MQKLTRKNALIDILKSNKDALIITSAGYVSRELYHLKDSSKHFYMMGSMGCCIGFAIGIALNSSRKVVAIVGDGEVLMSLGTLILTEELMLDNLTIYILNDGLYQSTGGQKSVGKYIPKCGFNTHMIDIEDKSIPPRIDLMHSSITKRFYNEINGS